MAVGGEMTKTPQQKAFRKWFDDAERRRKAAKLPRHRLAPDTPPRPCSASELHELIFNGPVYVGEARALEVLQVNRTTLMRWLTGAARVPHAAAVVLRFYAEGIPPACGEDWRGFRWSGNALHTPTGREVTAREIEGLEYLHGHVEALQRRVRELQGVIHSLQRLGGAANDSAGAVAQ